MWVRLSLLLSNVHITDLLPCILQGLWAEEWELKVKKALLKELGCLNV